MKLVASFGFIYGKPSSRDFQIVADARRFRNPHNNWRLRDLNGLDKRVQQFVLADPQVEIFIQQIIDKNVDCAAIGCLGGRHRSVAIAEEIGRRTGAVVIHLNQKDWPK